MGGTTRRMLCTNVVGQRTYVGPPDVRYYWDTLSVILGCMRRPLDHCAKTTGRTLGLPDVHCSVRELVTNFSYK
jgi:hypothetical protein